ncbi:MAG: tetratricopeptide repeat protein [Terracidiphilus sp.]|jgi:tetratricopeptide (TPR) repeat protein
MNRSLYLVPKRQSQRPPVDLNGICANAIQHHQRGELAEAERLYRQILDLDPRHADSLHLLGVMAHQVGRNEIAVELILKAIAVDKRPAAYHSNLGTAYQALGRLEEAAGSYERALAINPELAEAQMNLGVVLEAQGKHELAEERFRRALALRPNLAEAHVNLGSILQAQGKLAQAVSSYEQALKIKPEFAEASFNRANALQAQGRLEEAVTGYQRALELKPAMAEAHGNLGNALLAQKKLDAAEASYALALALNPNYAEAFYNQGNLRQVQEKLEEAVACYQRAIELKPQLAEAHYNLGNTLHTLDRLEEAAASFERALDIRPEYAEAHYNLGCVLEDLGRKEEALSSIARALEIKPDYPQARFGQALAQLLRGDFSTGWRNYETRWQSPDHDTPWREYSQPQWTGEKLASGRLLLWGEQGIGDEIQFAGLISDALGTGSRITLDCDARLKPLFARSFPEVEVVTGCGPAESELLGAPSLRFVSCAKMEDHEPNARSAASPPQVVVSQLPTGSLPGLFRISEAAFAASRSPYLKADPAERERFRARYDDGRKLIGLAWHTRNQRTGRKRCIALEKFAPLFALPGIRWISLQYGDFDDLEQQAAGAPIVIDRSVDQFADMDRFAAQVAAMDQVITIDNSTAHLAGALGLPVWLMLPFAADWRWLDNRCDSPWYPTLRLFRQPKIGDWDAVVECVRCSLAVS